MLVTNTKDAMYSGVFNGLETTTRKNLQDTTIRNKAVQA
jgi:hypothetical protein